MATARSALDEMSSALKGAGKGGHHHHHVAASDGSDSTSADGSSSDPLMQALEGASIDLGHQQRRLDHDVTDLCRRLEGDDDVGRGAPRAAATSSYNFIEQMIQRQAQAISASSAGLSVRA